MTKSAKKDHTIYAITNPNINPGQIEIPNNGIDEDCDGQDLLLSTNTFQIANNYSVYPNPVHAALTLKSDNNAKVSLSLMNVLGEELKYDYHKLSGTEMIIDLSDQVCGAYFLEINSEFNQRHLFKIVK